MIRLKWLLGWPLCFLRGLWLTVTCGGVQKWVWVSGHAYIEDSEPTPPNVQVLRCQNCGHYSVGWDWTGFKKHSAFTVEEYDPKTDSFRDDDSWLK